MKAVVVYESHWGTTKATAEAIAEGIGADVPVLDTDAATSDALAGVDLLVAGAPVYGFSLPRDSQLKTLPDDKKAPTPPDVSHPSVRAWLGTVPQGSGRCAGFDTRFKWTPGSAAKKIRKGLQKAGYKPIGDDGEFLIEGTYGPLKDGELDRARAWGKSLAAEVGA